jgi:uncharacterized protein (DUF983 family)
MVETKLIRPAKRAVDAWCPDCRHVRRIYSNASKGAAQCMYCGAEFEWEERAAGQGATAIDDGRAWYKTPAYSPVMTR